MIACMLMNAIAPSHERKVESQMNQSSTLYQMHIYERKKIETERKLTNKPTHLNTGNMKSLSLVH